MRPTPPNDAPTSTFAPTIRVRIERLTALFGKEYLQIVRDPSSLLIAFVLPLTLLFIFGYGLSLDVENVRMGVVLEDRGPAARSLWTTFDSSKYFDATFYSSREAAETALIDAQVRAVLVVPNDFSRRVDAGETATVQLLTDGCETNTAILLTNYTTGVCERWCAARIAERNGGVFLASGKIDVERRVRFNSESRTRDALVPGSIVIILAMIGTLLTALVVAREWERGTMEATLSTPVRKFDLIVGKTLPYFFLGLVAATCCAFVGKYLFGVPFRGSIVSFLFSTSAFMFCSTSTGLLISTALKNQFLASMAALIAGFLPNYLFSGVLFELDSTPAPIQAISYLFPARYYAVCLQTTFLSGDVWPLILRECAAMFVVGSVLVGTVAVATPKRLE